MKISRLLTIIVIAAFLFSGLAVTFLLFFHFSFDESNELKDIRNETVELGNKLANASEYLTREARLYAVTGDKEHVDNYWKEVNETKTTDHVVQRLKELGAKPEELALIEEAKNNSDALVKVEEQAMEAVMSGDMALAQQLMFGNIYNESVKSIMEPIHQFQNQVHERTNKESAQALAQAEAQLFAVIGSILMLILIVLGSSFVLIKRLKPIGEVAKAMEEVAGGNFAIHELDIKTNDEIGMLSQALNKMIRDLSNIVTSVYDSSHRVAAASEQLTASSQQSTSAAEQMAKIANESSRGAAQQLTNVKEVSSSMDEMSSGLQQIAESTEGMLYSSEKASTSSKNGSQSIHSVVKQMNDISTSVRNTSMIIEKLGVHSNEIGQITELITDIADQTNLLALNAAIEAARAGEYGKGFAVVADEVRKLAEESKKSTDKITNIITSIQNETEAAVRSMDQGNNKVQTGLTLTSNAEGSFKEIEQSIEDVIGRVQTVSAAIEEINAVSEDIVRAVSQVKEIAETSSSSSYEAASASEQQLASMEEITSSAESLSALANELQTLMSQFKLRGSEHE
ncbi:methyl-accepting chemotaxis protein [Bacillus tianshenii]|nr:methyl-accepting chemotaxis protein [Bacillus tianshenii]